MKEYKIVYNIKRDGISFESTRGNFSEFEIISVPSAIDAVQIAVDSATAYNKNQEEIFKNTLAIPDFKSVIDIQRL